MAPRVTTVSIAGSRELSRTQETGRKSGLFLHLSPAESPVLGALSRVPAASVNISPPQPPARARPSGCTRDARPTMRHSRGAAPEKSSSLATARVLLLDTCFG